MHRYCLEYDRHQSFYIVYLLDMIRVLTRYDLEIEKKYQAVILGAWTILNISSTHLSKEHQS